MSERDSKSCKKSVRKVLINSILPGYNPPKYAANEVKTSKYTLLSFLPRNLSEQFHGVANFYFLGVVVLQWFPQFMTTSFIVPVLPIAVIIAVTGLKVRISVSRSKWFNV